MLNTSLEILKKLVGVGDPSVTNESNFVVNPLTGNNEGPYTPESADNLKKFYAGGKRDLGAITLAITETPLNKIPELIRRIVKRS